MSYPSNGRHSRSSRGSTLSYWLPLAFTVTAAALGVALWIWSEQEDDDEQPPEQPEDDIYPRPGYDMNPDDYVPEVGAYGIPPIQPTPQESQSYMARMSGALRRTPSPQQIFDGASRSIVEGITAAGAVVGTALGSIIEEDRNAYKDHLTWSEEADARAAGVHSKQLSPTNQKRSESAADISARPRLPGQIDRRKTVAIVISAESCDGYEKRDGSIQENASMLSYLPQANDYSKIRLFILIYAPLLKKHPLDAAAGESPTLSFTNVSHDKSQTPNDESEKLGASCASIAFNSIYSQAISLTEKETMVLPFTTPTGHAQILRQLDPGIVYLQESLTGNEGNLITHFQSWLHQDLVVLVGDGRVSSGLEGSENGAELANGKENWWKREDRVGKGRGVVVIEASKVGDDWIKRVENKD